jgi:histone H3/H4
MIRYSCREIRKYQSTANLLVPRTPVVRLAKEIMAKLNPGAVKSGDEFPNRFAASAIVALQEAMEIFLVSLFEDANLCAIHAKRVTVMCDSFTHSPLCYQLY